jgi:hypothetical protein
LLNGKWIPEQAGDLHVNPRGLIHNSRNPNEDVKFISIFAPRQSLGSDINAVKGYIYLTRKGKIRHEALLIIQRGFLIWSD